MKIRKQYNDDYDSTKYYTDITDDTQTQQHLKNEVDVNTILAKWLKTGVIEHVKERQALYADVSSIDFRGALDSVRRAEEAFLALPSQLRRNLGNDPQNFIDWMQSDDDLDLKKEYGLLEQNSVATNSDKEPIPEDPNKQTRSEDRAEGASE